MILASELVPKRTRESTSKVRTGCSTCKARRVKCDEAKPICRRCAVGGRSCEYLAPRTPPPIRNVVTVYLAPTQKQPVFFINSSGLDFFHQKLAAKLDGQFDSEFWGKLVLQLSHSEPAIRHAVSAISVLHRDVESSLQSPVGYVSADPEAHQEWHAAMQSLTARIKAHPNSNLVPLVCCLLFTCIDFLRGNVDSALIHVQNGFKILAAVRRNDEATPGLGTNLSPTELEAIETHIIPMFSRLNALCTLFGRVTPPVYALLDRGDSAHESLADSRQRLFEIMDPTLRFIRMAARKSVMFEVDVDDFVEQVKLQSRLELWRTQFEDLLSRLREDGRPASEDAVNLLFIQYKVVFIWLRVCTSIEESAPDDYNKEFEELVDFAARLTKPGQDVAAAPQPLSFDMQLIGPLYYTAIKCRDPVLRRRALDLLRLAPRREGLWNAHHAYVTARRVIELEEMRVNDQGLPDETVRLHGVNLPSDDFRIYNVGELPADFRKFGSNIVPSPTYPGAIEVVFQTKPWGPLGEWHTIKELITL